MDFSRRNFIKFAVGGLGGTLLSPLPWKLIDDIAIWTQNWSWVPVPPRGTFSTVNTVCMLCSGACGIEVRKAGNRVVKIEGRKDYPVNRGGICPLGMAGQQILYNEGIRWKGPMKRIGPRGSLEWKEITWTEAIGSLTARIDGLRKAGAAEKLAVVDGNQSRSTMALLTKRLLNAIGSPNYMVMPRGDDTLEMAASLMQGGSGPLGFDLENSDFILSFGCGLLDGWGAPGRMLHTWGEWAAKTPDKRTYVVQVDSRLSTTASKADKWVTPFPGTESALALGIAHVIIREQLYNKRFIAEHAFGFGDWFESNGGAHKGFASIVLEKYTPQAVEGITGVKQKVINEVARKFAAAKAPLALAGRGKGLLPGSLYESMAVHALNALVGGINRKGGVLVTGDLPLAPWPDVQHDSAAVEALGKPRVDRAGTPRYPFAKSLIHQFCEAIRNSADSPIDTLLISSANPVHTFPDTQHFVEALAKIPFVASFSPFMDETSLLADLIVPDHAPLEKMADMVSPPGMQYPLYAFSKPAVHPLYGTRHSGDVIISLAKKLGGTVAGSFQWSHFEDALKERVKGLYDSGKGEIVSRVSDPVWGRLDQQKIQNAPYASFDALWDDLKERGCWYIPSRSFNQWSDIFQTPSKKFEFFSNKIKEALKGFSKGKSPADALAELGISTGGDEACMPHYEGRSRGTGKKEFPLVLYPVELINLASGWVGNPPFLNKTLFDHQLKGNDLFVEINPKTAAHHGLQEGSAVVLSSPKGELRVRVHLFEGAMPGIVFIPLGLGHTAYDKYLKGKGANPHRIIDKTEDPLSGQPAWWNTRIKVKKI